MKKTIIILSVILFTTSIYAGNKFSHKPILDFKVNSYLSGNVFTDIFSMDLKLGYQFKFYALKLQLYVVFNPYFNWEGNNFAVKKSHIFGGRFYISKFYIQFEHTMSGSINKKLSEFTEDPYSSYHFLNQFETRKTTLSIGFTL